MINNIIDKTYCKKVNNSLHLMDIKTNKLLIIIHPSTIPIKPSVLILIKK